RILHIEAHIEELTDIIERCRKIILISKVAIAAGAILVLATIIGAVGFNPTVLIGAIAAVIGGTVLSILDRDILTFNKTGFLQTLAKAAQSVNQRVRRSRIKKADHWHGRLLCAHGERPCRCCAAKQRDELASPQSIELHPRCPSQGFRNIISDW